MPATSFTVWKLHCDRCGMPLGGRAKPTFALDLPALLAEARERGWRQRGLHYVCAYCVLRESEPKPLAGRPCSADGLL